MELTLQILNEMQAAGLVKRYAIGGAIAAYFYSEAVVTEDLDGQTPTRVMRPEHLIALALKTGRAKDYARVARLLEEADVDSALLISILERHKLLDRWNQFKATQP